MTDEVPLENDSLHRQLVRYFHDCLAAQADWSHAINVVDQKDVTLVPLAASEQRRFGLDGFLKMSDPEAADLAKRVSAGGSDTSLLLGALFVVGCRAAQNDRAEKRFCAPLLEVSLTLRVDSDGDVVIYPDETEFTVNYSLVGELLEDVDDDLQDRLSELAELVPDFPIDAGEFDTFWNGFRMIAPEVSISNEPLVPRKSNRSSRIEDLGLSSEPRSISRLSQQKTGDRNISRLGASPGFRNRTVASAKTANPKSKLKQTAGPRSDSRRLDLVDFFVPRIQTGDSFQMLPATAIVFGRKAGRSMSALSELRAMEELALSQTAFGCVFDPPTARDWGGQPSARAYPDEVQPLPLTPAQRSIVESARVAPLTVVTGPPGTGKSYTITAIVLDALLNGQTVLVASQMDKAVEVVAEKVASFAGSLAIARSGGRAAQRKLAKTIARLTGPSNQLDSVSTSAVDDCAERHYGLTRRVQQLEESFQQVVEAEREWSRAFQSRARSEIQFSQPPVEVPVEVDDAHIRKAERLLERTRARLATKAGIWRRMMSSWDLSRVRRLLQVPSDSGADIDALTDLLGFHLLRLQMDDVQRSLKTPFAADLVWQELADVERTRHQTAIELLRLMRHKRLRKLVSHQQHRVALRDLKTLLRRRKHEIKQQLQEKLTAKLLLESFPAWACTSRSLCEILPATAALFDVVVIDEASQCDLALASVALMRGKRAVVVGDPNQLRHVSFLSRAREQAAFVASDFSAAMQERYRFRRSLFDVAADAVDQRHFFFLDEHFRSHPQIIEFSNQQFYDDSLRVMTGRPSRSPQSVISVQMVGGQRIVDSSINPAEVDAVVDAVRSITDDASSGDELSIGIVSPFRDHADVIRERLLLHYSSETIAKHSLIVGTAHSFQGDEKDIIIMSTSIDANSHPASLRFLESPNLFNVAITRARRRLIVVTSVGRDDLPPGLLREFLTYAKDGWSAKHSSDDADNPMEKKIADQLRAAGIDAWTGYRSAGERINVVAMGSENAVAILCDGGGDDGDTPWQELVSHRRLARAGWDTKRIPERTLHSDGVSFVETIHQQIDPSGD